MVLLFRNKSFSPIKHRPSTPRYRTPVKKDLLLLYLKHKKVRTDNTKAGWESEREDCEITPLDKDTDQNERFFFQEKIEDPEREAFETVNKAFKNLKKVGLGTQFHAFCL